MNHVSIIIDSRPENVPVVGACAKEMGYGIFSTEQLIQIEQALAEIINNCIEHAYGDNHEAKIRIDYLLSDQAINIEISDQGKPFDADKLINLDTDFNYDPEDISNLPEGGFGLKIIKTYMDEVNYRCENGTNYWSLSKYIL